MNNEIIIVNIAHAASISLSALMMHASVSLKDDIEGIRSWFFWSLIGSTVVVLIGVVIEGIEHIASGESSKTAWHKRAERIGWILVVMGVLGEGVFESFTTIADDIFQDFTSTLLRITTDQARNAAHSAEIAHKEADAVSDRAKEINRKLLRTETKLGAVETKRATLEQSLKNMAVCNSPRIIPTWSMNTPKGASWFNGPLLPLGVEQWSVFIEYEPNDAETFRAASSLATSFGLAHWWVSLKPSQHELTDGVQVQGFELSTKELTNPSVSISELQSVTRAREVAAAVVNFLHSYNWNAELGWMSQDDVERHVIPQRGIMIKVGLYPPVWYVAPPAMKNLAALNAELEKGRLEAQQKAEQAIRESNAKLFNQIQNQELVARLKAEEKQDEQRRRAAMQPYISPCQPLEPLPPIR